MKPHEHKDLILKWADGAEIEAHDESSGKWVPATTPVWQAGVKYRVKPVPVVETKMTDQECYQLFQANQPAGTVITITGSTLHGVAVALRSLASAAIARSVADGQVVPKEEYGRLAAQYTEVQGQAFELSKRGAERDMAVAEAVRDTVYTKMLGFSSSTQRAIDSIDLAAIIAKVKP
jgi:hypothetical protein